jgi:hypothetical protein
VDDEEANKFGEEEVESPVIQIFLKCFWGELV